MRVTLQMCDNLDGQEEERINSRVLMYLLGNSETPRLTTELSVIFLLSESQFADYAKSGIRIQ